MEAHGERRGWQLTMAVALTFMAFLLTAAAARAESFRDVPPGLAARGDWRPPGWSEGEKKGWNSDIPPGWEKWEEASRRTWAKELDSAKLELRLLCLEFRWTEADISGVMISFELMCRRGVPVRNARNFVRLCIREKVAKEDIGRGARALVYGVGRLGDFGSLELEISRKVKAGFRGDELVRGIYVEVQTRARKEKPEPPLARGGDDTDKRSRDHGGSGNAGSPGGGRGGGREGR